MEDGVEGGKRIKARKEMKTKDNDRDRRKENVKRLWVKKGAFRKLEAGDGIVAVTMMERAREETDLKRIFIRGSVAGLKGLSDLHVPKELHTWAVKTVGM